MARRPPIATVTTGEAENTEEVEAVVAGAEEGGADDGSDGAGGIRELQTTTKPPGKALGKAAKEKKEIHSRFLKFLEQEDDPVDLQFNSMAARVKQELPTAERFDVAYKLMGTLNEYIINYKRQQVVAKTFLNPGPQSVSVANVAQPTPAPPPPAMMAQPAPSMMAVAPRITNSLPPPLTLRGQSPQQQQQPQQEAQQQLQQLTNVSIGGPLLPLLHDEQDMVEQQYTFQQL